MILVQVRAPKWKHILASPIGMIEVPETAKTVYQAAKAVGITLPTRKAARTWDKIEPLWIMAALAKS